MLAIPWHVFLPGVSVEAAYADKAIVTQRRPAPVFGGETLDLPTSSAGAPTAVTVVLGR